MSSKAGNTSSHSKNFDELSKRQQQQRKISHLFKLVRILFWYRSFWINLWNENKDKPLKNYKVILISKKRSQRITSSSNQWQKRLQMGALSDNFH